MQRTISSIKKKYNLSEVETKWYTYWTKKRFFHSVPDNRIPYTVVIPPPNVTGVLHMGHMLNNTVQDILVRRARMMGKNACWVPGMDHASIATELKIVTKLSEKGVYKTDLNREDFLKHAWDWTQTHGELILKQLKKLGVSCDWERTCFTMDKQRSDSVIKVFVDLYNKGLIYRGLRMINWDPVAKTSISDEEIYYKERSGKLYYLRYQIVGEKKDVVVATTRPETIFGDAAICIHPNDLRYTHLKGKKVLIPYVNREIPVIEDEYISIEFGTGCLKVTPAHDFNDYVLGERNGLKVIDILNEDGTLNKYGLKYAGKDRFVVRDEIEKHLKSIGRIEKVEIHVNKVGFSERTHVPIEPKLSIQWFLKMKDLAKPALKAVQNGVIQFHPAKFKNIYRHWMENIKDWNISRQLWWGHRIPAYFLPEGDFVVAESKEQALVLAREKTGNAYLDEFDLRQEEDSLDTWFSSWLWPISVFNGVNEPNNQEIIYYYPTSDLVTAPDIIFFWVARMIMAGYALRKEPCFHHVYFTGIVRDEKGRKMSKSLGNSPEPLDLINRYGADGVRFGLMLSAPAGNDLLFNELFCEQGRNFTNKIWNVFRLIKGWKVEEDIEQPESSSVAVEWFKKRLGKTMGKMNDLFSKYRLSEVLMDIYKLFKEEFSSWYLEMIKPLYWQPIDKTTYQSTLIFLDSLLKLLHPFIPFITEEVWQLLEVRTEDESIMMAPLPLLFFDSSQETNHVEGMEEVKEIITNIRSIRLQKGLSNKKKLLLLVMNEYPVYYHSVILKLAHLSAIKQVKKKPLKSISFLVKTMEFSIPIENSMYLEEELNKLKRDLHYYEDFLNLILKKLKNKNFLAKAPKNIIEAERKKQIDAELKIKVLKESFHSLKNVDKPIFPLNI